MPMGIILIGILHLKNFFDNFVQHMQYDCNTEIKYYEKIKLFLNLGIISLDSKAEDAKNNLKVLVGKRSNPPLFPHYNKEIAIYNGIITLLSHKKDK